jgi:hypothetical protein
MSQVVRAKVVIPALSLLLVFLVGFPIWQHSPHSLAGRLFAWFFGLIVVAGLVIGALGSLANLIGPLFGFSPIREIWSDLRRRGN